MCARARGGGDDFWRVTAVARVWVDPREAQAGAPLPGGSPGGLDGGRW